MEGLMLFLFIVALVVAVIVRGSKAQSNQYQPRNSGPIVPNTYREIPPRTSELSLKNQISNNNPQFSEDNFKRYVEMVYIQYLSSITKREAPLVADLLHKELYEAHRAYIETLKVSNRNVRIENIVVNYISFYDYKYENNVETIKMHIKSRMNEYETDDNNLVISGYRSRVISKDDILTFQRDHNKLYDNAVVCAHCGAKLPNIAKKCEYCGTVVKFEDKTNEGWELCEITTL